jgi:short-subunit dehydrogenase
MMRVVVVTEANRGIGRELARQLVLGDDAVVLTARQLADAELAAADLQTVRVALEVNLLGAWQTTLTCMLAGELRGDRVLVAVCPGWVATAAVHYCSSAVGQAVALVSP